MPYIFSNRSELDTAVDAWINNKVAATVTYGDINTWDVSAINNFSELFFDKTTFNSDISNWDVSKGNNFSQMFHNASEFNQDIGTWDVSKGNNFSWMFSGAVKN